MAETIQDIIGSAKENYIEVIQSFDYDSDGQIRMYRRMGLDEARSVLATKELHTRSGHPKGEIWLSTSLKHSRQFENNGVQNLDEDVVMTFKVDIFRFCDQFKDEDIIHQEGSKKINKDLSLENLKCLVHNELLADHRWGKINFCLKGEANAEKFNKCVKSVKKLMIRKEGDRTVIFDPEKNDEVEHSSESEERMMIIN